MTNNTQLRQEIRKHKEEDESIWEFLGKGCLVIGELILIILTIYIILNYLFTGGYIT